MEDSMIVGLASAVMGILCGIIGIICGAISKIKTQNNERRLRESIIQEHVDAETARILVTPTTPKTRSPYTTLRWGLALVGIGLGYLLAWILELGHDFSTFVLMAAGCGLGLLVSFFVTYRLENGRQNRTDSEPEAQS